MFWSKRNRMRKMPLTRESHFVWFLIFGSVLSLIFMGARLPQDIQSLSTVDRDKTGWALSQVETGFYQLNAAVLQESRQDPVDSELIRLRAEVALGRLEIIKTSKNRELLSKHDDSHEWFRALERFKEQTIEIIDRPRPLNLADIAELESLIKSVLPMVRRLSVAGFVVATEQEERRRIHVTQEIMRFGILAIALLVSLALSLLYLTRLLKRAREKDVQLRTLTARLSTTLEASLDGVLVVDKTGKIIDFNEAATRVFGWRQKDILGKSVNETISPALGAHQNWSTSIHHLRFPKVRSFGEHRFESLALRKNNDLFPVEVTVTPLNDESGEVHLIAFKDISDLKAYENKVVDARKEAERTNKAKTQFLRAMSHEMRTPLTVILGALELLHIENLGNKQAALVNSATVSSEMLLALMNDALDITRVETGDIVLNPVAFSLLETTRATVDMITPLATMKGLGISIEFDSGINGDYFADRIRLSQILTNLLGNAVKYTDSGAIKVVVTGVRESKGVLTTIQIIDTGPGISEDQRERIFEYFVTSAVMQNERQLRSDGLGLPLSRKIARLLGGDITLDCEAEKGSTFTLELFLNYALSPVPHNLNSRIENQQPMSILLVEDMAQTSRVLEEFLLHFNHNVESASNGIEGIQKALKSRFDLIIMDVNMPLLDGREATRRIRDGGGPNKRTFILGLTAHNPADVREDLRNAGMNTVHAKPIRLLKLQEILQHPDIVRDRRCAS